MYFLLNAAYYAEGLPEGRVIGLDAQMVVQTVFILINVLALFAILTKLLYNPVRKFMYDRTTRIMTRLQEADEKNAAANEIRTEFERRLRDVDAEREAILEEARKVALQKTDEQLALARTDAEALRERAHKEISLEQARAHSELKKTVIELSSALATKILAKNIDAATHERLFDETLSELEHLAWHG